MPTFTIFDEYLRTEGDGQIDVDGHVFKFYLSDAAPDQAAHTAKGNIAEIASNGGYVAFTATIAWTETGAGSGVWRFDATTDPTWTAAGGDIDTHRYLILYDATASASSALVGYVDRGSSDIIASGATRTWVITSSGLYEKSATP